jgi:hypothetical protein
VKAKGSREGKDFVRKEDLLKILQEVIFTLKEAERFVRDDPTNARDISDATSKIRAVVVRLLSN